MRSKHGGLVFDDLGVVDSKYSPVSDAFLYDLKPAFDQERANNVTVTQRVVLTWRVCFGEKDDSMHIPRAAVEVVTIVHKLHHRKPCPKGDSSPVEEFGLRLRKLLEIKKPPFLHIVPLARFSRFDCRL